MARADPDVPAPGPRRRGDPGRRPPGRAGDRLAGRDADGAADHRPVPAARHHAGAAAGAAGRLHGRTARRAVLTAPVRPRYRRPPRGEALLWPLTGTALAG